MDISLRCSLYGETRRSGRIVKGTASISINNTNLQISSTSLLNILSKDNYSRRFVNKTDNIILLFPTTYNPATEGNGKVGDEEDSKHLNDPTCWYLVSNDVTQSHAIKNSHSFLSSSKSTKSTISSKKASATPPTIYLDIRFVPRFIYQKSPHSSQLPIATPSTNPASYFGVAIIPTITPLDPHIGTLWRSSYQQGASFTAMVGRKFSKSGLNADTSTCWASVPAFHFPDFATLVECSPYNCPIVCIAPGGIPLSEFDHPVRALYLVSDVTGGLSSEVLNRCPFRVSLPQLGAAQQQSATMSPIMAASLVMQDRQAKINLSFGRNGRKGRKGRNVKVANGKVDVDVKSSSSSTSSTSSTFLSSKSPSSTFHSFTSSTTTFDQLDESSNHLHVVIIVQQDIQQSRVCKYYQNKFNLELEYFHEKTFVFGYQSNDPEKQVALMIEINADMVSRRAVTGVYYCTDVRRLLPAPSLSSVSSSSASSSSLPPTTLTTASSERPAKRLKISLFGIDKIVDHCTKYPSSIFRLSVFPNTKLKHVIRDLPNAIPLDPKRCTHTGYFVELPNVELFGISLSKHNFNTSTAQQVYISNTVSIKSYSKSCIKLWELEINQTIRINNETICLEIGNASSGGGKGIGGWSEYMASKNRHATVLCVDPGVLRPSALNHTNLTHTKAKIEDAVRDKSWVGKQFNLCVCDLNCSIDECVRVVGVVGKYMKRNSSMVMTFRWNPGRDISGEMSEEMLNGTVAKFETCGCVGVKYFWLFANQKHERMLVINF